MKLKLKSNGVAHLLFVIDLLEILKLYMMTCLDIIQKKYIINDKNAA